MQEIVQTGLNMVVWILKSVPFRREEGLSLEWITSQMFSFEFLIPTVFSMLFRVVGLGHKGRGRIALGFGAFALYMLIVPPVLIGAMGYLAYTNIAFPVVLLGSAAGLLFSSDSPLQTILLQLIQANMAVLVFALCNLVWCALGMSYPLMLLLLLVVSALLLWIARRFWVAPLKGITESILLNWRRPAGVFALALAGATMLPVCFGLPSCSLGQSLVMLGVETGFILYLGALYRKQERIKGVLEESYRQMLRSKNIDALHTEFALQEERGYNGRLGRRAFNRESGHIPEPMETATPQNETAKWKSDEFHHSKADLPQYCQNPTANAMLQRYVRMARADGVTCKITTDIPASMPLTEQELCILFGNLLENACEACAKAPKDRARFLSVSAIVDDSHLLLQIRNTTTGTARFDRDGIPISNQPDGGMGTRMVVELLESHEDIIRFKQTQDIFSALLIIQL